MNVTLSPQAAELLRAAHDRYPEKSATELVEEALTECFGGEGPGTATPQTPAEIRAWLDELAELSEKIAPRPGETFPREMIYQDHDR